MIFLGWDLLPLSLCYKMRMYFLPKQKPKIFFLGSSSSVSHQDILFSRAVHSSFAGIWLPLAFSSNFAQPRTSMAPTQTWLLRVFMTDFWKYTSIYGTTVEERGEGGITEKVIIFVRVNSVKGQTHINFGRNENLDLETVVRQIPYIAVYILLSVNKLFFAAMVVLSGFCCENVLPLKYFIFIIIITGCRLSIRTKKERRFVWHILRCMYVVV